MEDTEVSTLEGMQAAPVSDDSVKSPLLLQNLPPDDAADRPRSVPYGALAEERARRKELQRELQESAIARSRLQERLETLQSLAGQSQVQILHENSAPAAPMDPSSEGAFSSFAVEAEANNAFRTQVLQSVRSYAAERPDFVQAYEHARQARVEELTALGYAPDEAMAITFDNEMEVINSAFAAGRNPAQVIYDFAVSRGYRATADGRPGAAGAGQDRSARVTAPLSEAQKIALAARGQASAKSLSAAGGGSTGPLTLEALAGMSDEEFAEATKGDRWRKLLGT